MENDNNYRKSDSVFSRKVRAGKRRTYFFDVRQTKGNDYYLTLTESTRRFNGDGYDRHKIFLYKEDFNRFMTNLEDAIDYVKKDLMPDYDYDEFTRRHEEWEENNQNGGGDYSPPKNDGSDYAPPQKEGANDNEVEVKNDDNFNRADVKDEDDMSW